MPSKVWDQIIYPLPKINGTGHKWTIKVYKTYAVPILCLVYIEMDSA